MSGLTIDHGGAISVDSAALRDVARRMDAVVDRYDEARAAIMSAHRIIVDTVGFSASVDAAALWAAADQVARLRSECQEASTGTHLMADVYEYVELTAEAAILEQADPAAARTLTADAQRLAGTDERIPEMAEKLVAEWKDRRFEGLEAAPFLPSLYGGLFATAAAVGARSGWGTVLRGETLRGTADPVKVVPVRISAPVAPPSGLAGALSRMPVTDGAQVAVEKYTFADGRARYVAYLKGTQSAGAGGSEPWDMKSNVELYTGGTSASYQATLDALDAAGAGPGDAVDVVAHSQSGMIAAHLAMESEYDVQVQITAGSPVEPTLDDDQTLIQLRHTDDPVSALAGGGSPQGTGSPDSVTVSREGDPLDSWEDIWVDTHMMHSYIETATQADASGDPRVEALGGWRDELGQAGAIERTEYRAERIDGSEVPGRSGRSGGVSGW